MTGLVRRATLITSVGLLAATAAMAGVPSATTSTTPLRMRVSPVVSGAIDPAAAAHVTYTIRDASNNPVPGSVLIMNFSGCSNTKISSTVVGAGMTVNCGAKTVTGVTNASGQVTMSVAGESLGGVGPISPCVSITADGVPLGTLGASTPDENGIMGATEAADGLDLAVFSGDLFNFPSTARSDFDLSGTVDGLDQAILVGFIFGTAGAGGNNVTATPCP